MKRQLAWPNPFIFLQVACYVLGLSACRISADDEPPQFIFTNSVAIPGYDNFSSESHLLQVNEFMPGTGRMTPSFNGIIARSNQQYFLLFPHVDATEGPSRWFRMLFFDAALSATETRLFEEYDLLLADSLPRIRQTYVYHQLQRGESSSDSYVFKHTFYSNYFDEGDSSQPIPLQHLRQQSALDSISFTFEYLHGEFRMVSLANPDRLHIHSPYLTSNLASLFLNIH